MMSDAQEDLASLLANEAQVQEPRHGDLLTGLVLSKDESGLIVHLGLKRDGIVPSSELESIELEDENVEVGDEVAVMVVEPVDRDGNLVVSISQARESDDWLKAQRLLDSGEIIEAEPVACNRGGVIVPFGRLRGFVPASHISSLPRGLSEEERKRYLDQTLGNTVPLKVIEVDPRRRRLVLSERKAIRHWRQQRKAEMVEKLKEGEILGGIVTSLREFGAFVDIGGADGLIHISELTWHRVENPADILSVGQEVECLVIHLDKKANRIGLSLKRLTPNPWERAAEKIHEGQEMDGVVSMLTANGAYIRLPENVEGLLSIGEGGGVFAVGDEVRVRVKEFEPERERMQLVLVEDDLEADVLE
jgi:small subunit ribosomal protein S1